MNRTSLKIKEWFIRKEQDKAADYNIFFDVTSRDEEGTITADENGFLTLICELLGETEKAIKVKIESGSVVGSIKGWTTWIPKSLIAQ